jgi:micrococcal nuclease
MGRIDMHRGRWLVLVVLTVVASSCNTRPTPDAFDPSTTSSATLSVGEALTTTPPTLPPPDERVVASVVSITDGDTVTVIVDGVEENLRMLGINAPEQSECWGAESTVFLTGLIEGTNVLLVPGDEDVDQFGRILRYIYLETPEGPVFVNSSMVESGNAIGMSNGHEFERSFKSLEAAAFQSGLGMWGTFICGDTEGLRADRPVVRVSDIQFNPSGPDNEHLDQEYVTIVNEGYGRVAISGWTVRDESSQNRFTLPPDTVLAPGESATIVTGCTGGPVDAIHWCHDGAVWSNDGDTAIVSDTLGNAVIWYAYSSEQVDG